MQPGTYSYDEPQVPAAKHAGVLAASSANAPLVELEQNIDVNVEGLFKPSREVVDAYGQTHLTTIRRIGSLNLTSGVVGVRDFAMDPWRIAPLARRIKPGRYPVTVVEVLGQVAAIKVEIDPAATPASWFAAATIRNQHFAPVDLGAAAIFDVAGFIKMSAGHKQDLFSEHRIGTVGGPTACLVSMLEPDDALVVTSGSRDSGYPSYWGVDDGGQIVSLVVDFLVLARIHQHEVAINWNADLLGSPILSAELAQLGLSVTLIQNSEGEIVVAVVGNPDEIGVTLVAADGRPNFKSQMVVRSGNTRSHVFTGDIESLTTIHLAIYGGYSN